MTDGEWSWVQHRLGYGQVGRSNGKKAFRAECSCGWKELARAKLTYVISDLRTHSALAVKEARAMGWEMRKGDGLSVDVRVPANSQGVSPLPSVTAGGNVEPSRDQGYS